MSWARYSGDSDVYIYEDVTGGVICCGCGLALGETWGCVNLQTVREIDSHIRSHRDAGHIVPEYVDECFRQWIAEYPERQQQAVECGVIW